MKSRTDHLVAARRKMGEVEVELCPFCGKLPQMIGIDGNLCAYIKCVNYQSPGPNISGCGVEMRYTIPNYWPRKCKTLTDLYVYAMTLCLKKWNRRAKPLTTKH